MRFEKITINENKFFSKKYREVFVIIVIQS